MNYHISPRELEILHLVAFEHNTKEIAQELFISEHTVISHRKNLLMKMDVKNTAGLVRRAFEIGILALKNGTSVAFVMFFLCFVQLAGAQCHVNDFKALKDLYTTTNGATDWNDNTNGWGLVANNTNPPSPCVLSTMEGITVNNGRVIAVSLPNSNLTGSLSTLIGLLDELQELNLSDNSISGSIPASLGDIATLQTLILQRNNSSNSGGFSGPIPITGSNFLNLKTLRLNLNSLTGGIPSGVGAISNLEELSLHRNILGGGLPERVGHLTKLTKLKLYENSLVDCIPASYNNLISQLTIANIDKDNNLDALWADFVANGAGECPRPFITTWKTDNTQTNSSCASCILIPTDGSGYNYDIDFENDGVYDVFDIVGDYIHDYGTAGTYQVAIKGAFPRINFASSIDEEDKILSVDQWGDIAWENMQNAFRQCSNLDVLASDAPDLSLVMDMGSMFASTGLTNPDFSQWNTSTITQMNKTFQSCDYFNSDISMWDVSSVVRMDEMLEGAMSFDHNLGDWQVSSVSNMTEMLDLSGLSKMSYDSTLMGWAGQSVLTGVPLGALNLKYCHGLPARLTLLGNSWIIQGDNIDCSNPFITTWKTDNFDASTSCGTCITIPTYGNEIYNYDIDWDNNGTYDTIGVTGNITHNFGLAGTYQIAIRGVFPRIFFNDKGDKEKLLSVDQWGDIEWESMERAFFGCINMNVLAVDNPDLSLVKDMSLMFKDASSFNADISSWDVDSITRMSNMFSGATSFNSDLSGWDVDNVTHMGFMFNGASAFTSDLSQWNVENVTYMGGMFQDATSFSSDLSAWQVDSVTYTGLMFSGATSFSSDLSDWKLPKVTHMNNMFFGASSFNSDLSQWNVENVIVMTSMFDGASSFTSDLSGWNVDNVISMSSMFCGASSFTSDLSDWQVDNVTGMFNMFYGASSFTSDLSEWEVDKVQVMNFMFGNSGMNINDYDATLIGWESSGIHKNNVTLGATNLEFCASANARQRLIDDHFWEFVEDGPTAGGSNTWTAGVTNNWNDDTSLWSLMYTPSFCNDVTLPTDSELTIQNEKKGLGATLDVETGAILEVVSGGQLEIRTIPE